MRFEIEIEDAALGGLASSIRTQLEADPTKREALVKFAMDQLLGWMCGRTSYQSMTECQKALERDPGSACNRGSGALSLIIRR